MKLISLILISVLISCKSKNSNTKFLPKSRVDRVVEEKIDKDSVRVVGESIINGTRIWGKNEKYIFSLMDSLTNTNSEVRLFYFRVFGKICEQADGYVGEAIGLYVLKYFEQDPCEFIKNSKSISDSVFKSMGYNAGLEISMTNDREPSVVFQRLKAKTIDKAVLMSVSEKQRLDLFFKQMKEGLDSNKE